MRNGETFIPSETPPPSFEEAKNLRQKARAAGLNPNYWYAVEQDKNVKPGKIVEVTFWKRKIVLFRSEDGKLSAVAGRCLHRQLRLCKGAVKDGHLVCPYHGWTYDGDGKVVGIQGEQVSSGLPKSRLHAYPVQIRYGLIWVFPGDPELADKVPPPRIPELDQAKPWPHILLDLDVAGHHSCVIDNVSDFTHAFLHRRWKPFWDAKLKSLDPEEERVRVSYETRIGGGSFYNRFIDRKNVDSDNIELCYEYPYQWSNTGGKICHWLFVVPIDERRTRTFYIFYFNVVQLPFIGGNVPDFVMKGIMAAAKRVLFTPLLNEDNFAVENEQEGYEAHHDSPPLELNPAVRAFQRLTIKKWEEHLEAEAPSGEVPVKALTEPRAVRDTAAGQD